MKDNLENWVAASKDGPKDFVIFNNGLYFIDQGSNWVSIDKADRFTKATAEMIVYFWNNRKEGWYTYLNRDCSKCEVRFGHAAWLQNIASKR